jgi:hypothetical protein
MKKFNNYHPLIFSMFSPKTESKLITAANATALNKQINKMEKENWNCASVLIDKNGEFVALMQKIELPNFEEMSNAMIPPSSLPDMLGGKVGDTQYPDFSRKKNTPSKP